MVYGCNLNRSLRWKNGYVAYSACSLLSTSSRRPLEGFRPSSGLCRDLDLCLLVDLLLPWRCRPLEVLFFTRQRRLDPFLSKAGLCLIRDLDRQFVV